MAVLILTLLASIIMGGLAWLVLGSRFSLNEDEQQNDILNFIAFVFGALPVGFVLVFFGLGG